jgi:hypothetical protein
MMVSATQPGAQRRSGGTGVVTFAILVSDPSGAPVPDVKVTLTGPAQRTTRTQGGRAVFENLPSGTYQFRFEKDGFIPVERQLPGRGAKPIDVLVTMTSSGRPTPPLATVPVLPVPGPAGGPTGKLVVLDMPAFIEKNYVGRASGKSTPLGCGIGGAATLVQINEPIAEHTHPDADEFIYVIAGQGTARAAGRVEPLSAAVFMMIPRGTPHAFETGPKKPLVMVSTRAGEKCAP